MVNLTFGEQVKIILSRKGMTIKELAEQIEAYTGKPMSRQNLTQRLGRDNFQEKDMRLIAEILGCKFQLSIMEMDLAAKPVEKKVLTVGEILDMSAEAAENIFEQPEKIVSELDLEKQMAVNETETPETKSSEEESKEESEERKLLRKGVKGYFRKSTPDLVSNMKEKKETKTNSLSKEEQPGEINPYTGKEYKTNSVRMHPKQIGYVQVYDQEQHKWTDMTEWAFLGYQERKKRLLGKDYEPPIYLD